jgi:glycosyltransferase involved in cell wall biosynthesis
VQRKICIISTGQPSTNPRLVKEADALSEAGFQVTVIVCHWVRWADELDKNIVKGRSWSCRYAGGNQTSELARYYWTRIRHKAARTIVEFFGCLSPWAELASTRAMTELSRAALETKSDLYIAHYLGALPAACRAAKKYRAKVSFDAEDYHRGQLEPNEESYVQRLTVYMGDKYIPQCDFMVSASPLISDAYRKLYPSKPHQAILNVFPMSLRPKKLILSDTQQPLRLFWFSQTIGSNRGLEDVIRAMGLLGRRDIELHLLGQWLTGFRPRFMKLIAEAGLQTSQFIFHPTMHPDFLVQFASQYDIGLAIEQPVNLNRQICLTNKIFIYLMAGNALIATDTPAQRPVAAQIGEDAWIYCAGDIEKLSRGIQRWANDRDSLNRARSKSWTIAESKFNWDTIEKKTLVHFVKANLDL